MPRRALCGAYTLGTLGAIGNKGLGRALGSLPVALAKASQHKFPPEQKHPTISTTPPLTNTDARAVSPSQVNCYPLTG